MNNLRLLAPQQHAVLAPTRYQARCRCGFAETCATKARAETLAAIHDAASYRRPHQHDADVVAIDPEAIRV